MPLQGESAGKANFVVSFLGWIRDNAFLSTILGGVLVFFLTTGNFGWLGSFLQRLISPRFPWFITGSVSVTAFLISYRSYRKALEYRRDLEALRSQDEETSRRVNVLTSELGTLRIREADATASLNETTMERDALLLENGTLRETVSNPKLLLETSINSVTGLINFYERLEKSPYHPQNCLPDITRFLDFMGNGASKWTIRIPEDMLLGAMQRISQNNGQARFLILNPLNSKVVKTTENKTKIVRSLRRLRDIQRLLPSACLKIRVFDLEPQFRLTFIDKKLLVIGHYGGENKGDSNYSPLLEFSGDDSWSFFHAYKEYFDLHWNDVAVEPMWDEINAYWNSIAIKK